MLVAGAGDCTRRDAGVEGDESTLPRIRGASGRHERGVWFDEPCEEVALLSDQYDFAISLLHLDSAIAVDDEPTDEGYELDTFRT